VAPAGCPGDRAFENEIASRTRLASRTSADARTFVVSISATPGGSSGVLEIRERDGTATERRVKTGSCEETVSALALVAALALDPTAGLNAQPAPPVTSPTPPAVPLTHPEQAPACPVAPPAVPIAEPAAGSYGSGIAFSLTGGAAPRPLLGAGAFLEAGRAGAFAARLSLADYPAASVATDVGSARFTLLLARAELCRPLAVTPVVELSLCAGFEAGRHSAEAEVGAGVSRPDRQSATWAAPVGAFRIAIDLGPMRFETEGNLGVPLVREDFVVDVPEQKTVYRAPAVEAGARFGLGMHFSK
jgi:hypothetical protein